jgi:hypothetical protein
MKDARPRAFAVLVAVFLIGILLGAGGFYMWLKPAAASGVRPNDGRFPQQPSVNNVRPDRPSPPDFKLTSEQQEQLGNIWKETGEKLQALAHDQDKQRALGEAKRQEIWAENEAKARNVLNEEQRADFDAWIDKIHYLQEQTSRRKGPIPQNENRKQLPRRKGPMLPNENPQRPENQF